MHMLCLFPKDINNSQGITAIFPDFAENHLKSWAQGFKLLSQVNDSSEKFWGKKLQTQLTS